MKAYDIVSPVKLVLISLVLAALYFFSAKLGLVLAIVQKNATPVWPPTGIAIAAMLIFGYRIWPGIFLGAFAVNLTTNISFITSLAVASGNTLESVVAVYLVWKLIGSSNPLTRATDFFKFIIVACLFATTISATVGVTSLALSGELPWTAFGKVWGIWWAGDAVGGIVIAPLILSFFYERSTYWNVRRGSEAAILIFITSIVGLAIFGDFFPDSFSKMLIGLSLVPILIWSSFRFSVRGTSTLILLVSVISILGTAQGHGPFRQESINESVILLQGFIGVTALTIISLTIVVGEYNRAISILRKAHDDVSLGKDDSSDKGYLNAVWRSLAKNTPDQIMLLDTEGKILFINHTVSDLSADEVIGRSVYEFIEPEQVEYMRDCYQEVLNTGEADQFEIEYRGDSNSIIFENQVGAVKQDNKIIGLIVSSRDITKRKKTEFIKDRLMAIVEATPDFIAMADKQGQALYVNAAGRKMVGIPLEEDITTTKIPDYHSELEAQRVLTEILPIAREKGVWYGEVEFLNRDGKEIPTLMVLIAHKSDDGKIDYYSAIARDITDRIHTENKLIESQTMLELVLNTIPVRVFWKDTNSTYLGCNNIFAKDAGVNSQDDMIGLNDYDFFPEQAELYRTDDKQVMVSGVPKLNYEEPQDTPDGSTIWLQTTKIPLRNIDKEVVGVLGTYDDITERKRVENIILTLAKRSSSLSSDDMFFKECLRNLGEFYKTQYVFIGLLDTDDKNHVQSYLIWKDGNFVDNFEYDLEGTPCQDVINLKTNFVPEGVSKLYPHDQLLIDMQIDSYYGAALFLPNGEAFGLVVVTDSRPLELEPWTKPILEIFASRIAIEMERKRTEEELHGMASTMSYQATHDPLTDLINRREFEERLQIALKISKLEGHQHALCYLDLDQFKVVNDTCGHIAGDELLKQLAEHLLSVIRESDTLGRLGGDEFGVLLQDCPIEQAIKIAESILNVVKQFRFAWEDKLFEIGVSIGVVAITQDTVSINQALSAADASCYLAKEHGRNRIHIYQEDDTELAKRHGEMQVVTEITQALEDDRFVLYFQSIVPLDKHRAKEQHFEVLIRMYDRDHNLVPPGTFIGAAERYNLMPAIDKWVIKNAFMYLSKKIIEDSADNILCAINLSGTTLSEDNFIDYMHDMLEEFKLPPEIICFEITETAAITNISKAMHFISQFKETGFKFALDDFGAGLSSYSYLKNLPIDYIKIDGSFVSGISHDPLNRSIVESINQVGHTMGIETIAEWVDSEDVRKTLTEIGIDYAQGYSINKPRPLK